MPKRNGVFGMLLSLRRWFRKNTNEAEKLLLLSANQGSHWAQLHLGSIALIRSEAYRWSHLSAEHGNDEAQLFLAILYEEDGNWIEAKKWYQLSKKNGNSASQHRLDMEWRPL